MASTSTQQHQWKYDVFVSFRSNDTTGEKFTDHLFEDFKNKGIRAFIRDDKDGNKKRKEKEGMKKSAVLLVIFSKKPNSSSWCLTELGKILKFNSDSKHKHEVRILCYDVKPGVLGKAIKKHHPEALKNASPNAEPAERLKDALSKAAEFPRADGVECSKYLDSISEEILDALSLVPLHLGENLVGVDACVKNMNLSSRFVKSAKVKMIGIIYGRKGTGKTTLAKAAYNAMRAKFQKCFFYEKQSQTQAQTQLIIGKTMKTRVKEIPKKRIPVVLHNMENRHETKFMDNISEQVLKMCHDHVVDASNLLPQSRQLGDLVLPDNNVIGEGSNETIVLKGTLDTRPVTVKRISKKKNFDVAVKEISNLIASDQLTNIVQYYGAKEDTNFVYMAFERCVCSLHELVLPSTNDSIVQLKMKPEVLLDFKLRKPDGHPSLGLLKVMRDTVTGLAHLHKRRFIHLNLKPENVLIFKDDNSIIAKLSGMSTSERLPANSSSITKSSTGSGSSGWQAPEQLHNKQITQAVDLFSFGCLLFFCITGGQHPFVENHKDLSLVSKIPEAFDLISNLLHHKPKFRPKAAVVYNHPLFWDSDMRLSFLQDASAHVHSKVCKTNPVFWKSLESINTVVLDGENWDKKLHDDLVKDLENPKNHKNRKNRKKRKNPENKIYKYDSVRDLLRAIRNKRQHYDQLSQELKVIIGKVPTDFENYFSSRFPKLLMEVYKILQNHRGEGGDLLDKYYKQEI